MSLPNTYLAPLSCAETHYILFGGKPIRTISGVLGIDGQIRIRISSFRIFF